MPREKKIIKWIKNIHMKWWARSDLNRGPRDYESPALTAELRALYMINTDLQAFFLQPQKRNSGSKNSDIMLWRNLIIT